MSRARLIHPRPHPDAGWTMLPPVEPKLRRWLADSGSLTAALRGISDDFGVRLLAQGWAPPGRDEAALLHGGGSGPALGWVREVLLCDGATPLVFAHTAVGHADLEGWPWLRGLGRRPLGEVLFRHPRVVRLPLRFRRLDARHPLYHSARLAGSTDDGELWARRSLFRLDGRLLLVTEVFLPALLARLRT